MSIADIALKCIRSVIGRAGFVFLMEVKVDGLQMIASMHRRCVKKMDAFFDREGESERGSKGS